MKRFLTKKAKALRKNQTSHEKCLWRLLRAHRFAGFKFRRQHDIGPYIVDFYCHEKKLIIELDGGGHSKEPQEQKDKNRDQYFKNRGYQLLRIWNNELFENQAHVLEFIFKILCTPATPLPCPSPRRGEGDSNIK
jgi:type I restriction enzyme M protein